MSKASAPEPAGQYALVQGAASGRVYMRPSVDVLNGWHDVTNGYGTDLTWGELLFWEDQAVTVLFKGVRNRG